MSISSQSQQKLLPASGRYRDLEPRSLIDRREALNSLLRFSHRVELRVAIYAYGEDCYLISATTGITESGTPIKLPYATTDLDLGHAAFDLFLKCYAHATNTADASLAGWAVFGASGARSGKSFEAKSTYVTVRTSNMAIVVEASRRLPPSDIYVGSQLSITCDPAALGSAIKKLVSTLRLLDSQDAL